MSISVPHNSDMMALRRATCWNCRSFETPLLEITTCDDSDEEPPPLLDRYDSESSEELPELVDEETEDWNSEEKIQYVWKYLRDVWRMKSKHYYRFTCGSNKGFIWVRFTCGSLCGSVRFGSLDWNGSVRFGSLSGSVRFGSLNWGFGSVRFTKSGSVRFGSVHLETLLSMTWS